MKRRCQMKRRCLAPMFHLAPTLHFIKILFLFKNIVYLSYYSLFLYVIMCYIVCIIANENVQFAQKM